MYRDAYFLCRDRAQAEDPTRETFLRAGRVLSSLRDDAKAKRRLFATLRREHARHFERNVSRHEPLDPERVPDTGAESHEVLAMRQATLQLPDRDRDVLLLQVIGGDCGLVIARPPGTPRATVNTRLFRARNPLRRPAPGRVQVPDLATATPARLSVLARGGRPIPDPRTPRPPSRRRIPPGHG